MGQDSMKDHWVPSEIPFFFLHSKAPNADNTTGHEPTSRHNSLEEF